MHILPHVDDGIVIHHHFQWLGIPRLFFYRIPRPIRLSKNANSLQSSFLFWLWQAYVPRVIACTAGTEWRNLCLAGLSCYLFLKCLLYNRKKHIRPWAGLEAFLYFHSVTIINQLITAGQVHMFLTISFFFNSLTRFWLQGITQQC